ncbi:MAG: hypothetical protein LC792_00915 [Actinobacteria bacterium]|nr:hypothetical protein [Actinomycetota bacterium]
MSGPNIADEVQLHPYNHTARVSTVVCRNGTLAQTTSPALAAAMVRHEWPAPAPDDDGTMADEAS